MFEQSCGQSIVATRECQCGYNPHSFIGPIDVRIPLFPHFERKIIIIFYKLLVLSNITQVPWWYASKLHQIYKIITLTLETSINYDN